MTDQRGAYGASCWRKKPIVIEAMQVTPGSWAEVLNWVGDSARVSWVASGVPAVDIKTLEGTMRANVGWWVIKGVQGEFYPCDPDIFAATYEDASPDPRPTP